LKLLIMRNTYLVEIRIAMPLYLDEILLANAALRTQMARSYHVVDRYQVAQQSSFPDTAGGIPDRLAKGLPTRI